MPFYRYECRNCGHDFRYLHVANNHDEVACPKCGGTDLERQPPRVAVQFKGSGYYKTDRANKKSKVGTKGRSGNDTSESDAGQSKDAKDSKSNAASDSKSESKSDKKSTHE